MSQANNFSTRHLGGPKGKTAPLRDFDTEPLTPWVVEFRVVGTPYMVRAPMGKTFTLGRAEPEREYHPDLDLTEYDAQGLGVSRKHARLTAQDNRVVIQDLGSANGTYINGERLETLIDYRIQHGDVLKLGRLELQINFVVTPMVDPMTRVGAEQSLTIPRLAKGEPLLIVDESEDVARVIGYAARQAGFDVTGVVTIEDAISEIDRQSPKYIITELMFEAGSGVDLVRYVRNKSDGANIQIMVVTSATAGFNMGQALEKGADYFLGKPIAMEELINGLVKMAQPQA